MLGLLCVQLGPGPKGEELFHSLQPLLVSVLSDGTACPAARLHVSVLCSVTPFPPLIPKGRGRFHLLSGSFTLRVSPVAGNPGSLSNHSVALPSFQQCASALGLGCYVAAADVQVSDLWAWLIEYLGPGSAPEPLPLPPCVPRTWSLASTAWKVFSAGPMEWVAPQPLWSLPACMACSVLPCRPGHCYSPSALAPISATSWTGKSNCLL